MKYHTENIKRYAIRKGKFGVASVAVASLFLFNGTFASAAEENAPEQPSTEQLVTENPVTEQPSTVQNEGEDSTETKEKSTLAKAASETDNTTPTSTNNTGTELLAEAVSVADTPTTATSEDVIKNTKKDNEMLPGAEFNGKYGVQLTVTGKDGQTYTTTYGGYSLMNIDQIDTTKPIQADFTIVNGNQDVNANIILTLPNFSAGGNSSLVFDGSTVDKNTGIQLTSSLGQDYSSLMRYGNKNGEYEPLTQYTNKYSADAFNEQLRAVRLDGGQIKANDTLSFSLNLKLKESDPATTPTQSALFQIYNFINGHNGYVTDNLNLALIHQDAIGTGRLLNKVVYPTYLTKDGVDGGEKWVYASDLQDVMPTPDKLFRFGQVTNTTTPESGIQAEQQEDGYYLVKSNDASLGEFPNLSPYYFLLLPEVQAAIHTHGYTANPARIAAGYYIYGGGSRGVTIEGGADMETPRENGAQILHFQVIPSILLKENQVHTVVAADAESKTWDSNSMIKQFTDPNKVKYPIAEDDTNQLDKKDLTVTIYDITKGEDAAVIVNNINLSKVGKYKVIYSHTFKDSAGNDLPISNTGYVSVVTGKQQLKLKLIDTNNAASPEVLETYSLDGNSNEAIDTAALTAKKDALIKKYTDLGYKFVSHTALPTNFDASNNVEDGVDSEVQTVEVVFVHDTQEVTTTKDAKRTIHYIGAGALTPNDQVQMVKDAFKQTTITDKVTKKVINQTEWNPASVTVEAVTSPIIENYTANQLQVADQLLTATQPEIEVTITYTKNEQHENGPSNTQPENPSVEISEVSEQAPISHQVIFMEDSTLDEGVMIVVQEGTDGYIETVYTIATVDGDVVAKQVVSTKRVEATNHIVRIGTKKYPELPNFPGQAVVPIQPSPTTSTTQLPQTGTTNASMTIFASLAGLAATIIGYTGVKKSKEQ